MDEWIPFALAALVLWGLWGFFPKIAVNHIDPKSVLVFEVVGTAIVGFIVLFMMGFTPQFNVNGFTFALLTGLAGALGALFFLFAVSKGKLSVVAATTAMYPLVTIMLASLFLGETLTLKQGIGVILALSAIVMFSL